MVPVNARLVGYSEVNQGAGRRTAGRPSPEKSRYRNVGFSAATTWEVGELKEGCSLILVDAACFKRYSFYQKERLVSLDCDGRPSLPSLTQDCVSRLELVFNT